MWTMQETNAIRQSLKMKLSNYNWYLASYVVPDFEGYAIQVEISKCDNHIWNLIPDNIKQTNIKIQVKNGE
jgi:hypothetical protein